MAQRDREIASLNIQLATFKTENDELLKERLERKKEFGRMDEIKASLAAKQQAVESLEAS